MGLLKTLSKRLSRLTDLDRNKKKRTLQKNNLGDLYSPSDFSDVEDINWKKKSIDRDKRKKKSRKRRESRKKKKEMLEMMMMPTQNNYGLMNTGMNTGMNGLNFRIDPNSLYNNNTNAATAVTAAAATTAAPTTAAVPPPPVQVPRAVAELPAAVINNPSQTLKVFQEAVFELASVYAKDKDARISKYEDLLMKAKTLGLEAEADTTCNSVARKITNQTLEKIEKSLTEKEKMFEQKWEELSNEAKILDERYQTTCKDKLEIDRLRLMFRELKNEYHKDTGRYSRIVEQIRLIVDRCTSVEGKYEHDQYRIAQALEKLESLGNLNTECKKEVHLNKLKPHIKALKAMVKVKTVESDLLTRTVEAANLMYDTTKEDCLKIHTELLTKVSPYWTAAKYAAYGVAGAAVLGGLVYGADGLKTGANILGNAGSNLGQGGLMQVFKGASTAATGSLQGSMGAVNGAPTAATGPSLLSTLAPTTAPPTVVPASGELEKMSSSQLIDMVKMLSGAKPEPIQTTKPSNFSVGSTNVPIVNPNAIATMTSLQSTLSSATQVFNDLIAKGAAVKDVNNALAAVTNAETTLKNQNNLFMKQQQLETDLQKLKNEQNNIMNSESARPEEKLAAYKKVTEAEQEAKKQINNIVVESDKLQGKHYFDPSFMDHWK